MRSLMGLVVGAGLLLCFELGATAQVEEIDPLYDEDGEPAEALYELEDDGDLGDEYDTEQWGDNDFNERATPEQSASPAVKTPADDHYPKEAPALDEDDSLNSDAHLSDPAIFQKSELPDFHGRTTAFSLTRRPADEPRSYWWPALLSIPLPGFGQWYDGQYEWALGYGAAATGGLIIAGTNIPDGQKSGESDAQYRHRNLFGVKERRHVLGLQIFQSAGGMSAYHSFRSAVRTRQKHGEFGFLRHEESISDIMLAPFDFQFLTRPTTFIPLLMGGLLYVAYTEFTDELSSDWRRRDLEGSDAAFASMFSYNAGTHEEAVFRGWVQPMFYHITGAQSFWSNVITSGIFAAAHIPSNPTPLPQFALSMHLGWVAERNHWTLAESVFIHTWWDVIVFLAQYQVMERGGADSTIEPALHLPPIEFRF